MITITLPDGSRRSYDAPQTIAQIALSIGAGLARAALAGRVDGQLVDASYRVDRDAAVEIVTDRDSRAPAHDLRDKIVDLCFERGALFLGCGENTLRVAPPLIVTREQADNALDILEESITSVEGKPVKKAKS